MFASTVQRKIAHEIHSHSISPITVVVPVSSYSLELSAWREEAPIILE